MEGPSAEEIAFVKQYEQTANVLYNTPDTAQRNAAMASMATVTNNPQFLMQAKSVFLLSEVPVALHHAARSIKMMLTERWSTFAYVLKTSTLMYMVQFLGAKGLQTPSFVTLEVCLLIARITKLGWFEGNEMKEVVPQCGKFLQTASHAPLGLKLLAILVSEMNEVLPGTTLTQHRKIATSFRDRSLLQIFQMALTAHRQALDLQGPQREAVLAAALDVSHKCLSFDFIGTAAPPPTADKAEEGGTVAVPNSWRDLFESEGVLRLLFQVYKTTQPATAKLALQCLTQVASVRRSVFTGVAEREDFLTELMRGVSDIIRSGAGLNDAANHHELCRLLARMKANFQLKQIIKCPAYPEWISLMAAFTTKSFQAWQWAPTSVYYLLSLWSRMVASISYLQQNEDTKLEALAPVILESYVRARIGSVDVVVQSGGSIDDPLDETSLREEMEALPTLGRLKFQISFAMLVSLFDPLASEYERRLLNMSNQEAFVAESKLTWLVHVCAAVIGGRLATSATPEADKLDGELSARLFRLMNLHDRRVQAPNFAPSTSTPRLELALLRFLQEFRKVYIGDYATAATSLYARLSELLGLQDPNAVLALILQKICNNLRFWAKNHAIVDRTLSLCNTISSGYGSGKMLRKVELTNHLFLHHTSQHFPFLDVPANTRARTNFYNTLGKLLFLDCSVREFNAFMMPFGVTCARLLSVSGREQFRQPAVMTAVTGLLRDLRGVVDATISGPTYNMFFDWLYESKAPPSGARFSDILVRVADTFYDMPEVTSPLLKFVAEFVYNKSSRIAFDSSSPNGILLFRVASEVLVAYGSKVLDVAVPPAKLYQNRFKGIWICLKLLRNALQGGYVNFGVFQLYGDPALANALQIVFKLMFSVPLSQIMSYPKFMEAHFSFIDTLCSEHTYTVALADSATFRNILESIKEGLGSLDQAICSHCCAATDKLADFYYVSMDRDTPAARGIRSLMKEQQHVFNEILALLFNIIIFEECMFQWSISRPMLSLIVINPQNFQSLKVKLCQSMMTQEQGMALQEALKELMQDIDLNLSGKNRDKFTQRLSIFRHTVKSPLLRRKSPPLESAASDTNVNLAEALQRAKALHSSQPRTHHHSEMKRMPIRLTTEAHADECCKLLSAGDDNFVWVQCAELGEVGDEELTPLTPVLYRFLRGLQATNSPVTELSLSGVAVQGEAFKALLSMVRSPPPALQTLLLDDCGFTVPECTELALAASESRTLQYLSLARNGLTSGCGFPLAQLIRRSKTLRVLDCTGNEMRSKGILEMLVALRDRELRATNSARDNMDNVVVSVNKINVVVTLAPQGEAGGAGAAANDDDFALNEQLNNSAVPLSAPPVPTFELRVSDNTLTASETAALIITDLKAAKVVGIPETETTFTSPDEKLVKLDATAVDGKAVRRAMRQQAEKVLLSGGGDRGDAIVLHDTMEALTLAQIVNQSGRPSIHLDFGAGTKHYAKADILDSFLQGVRDNSVFQTVQINDAALSRPEMSAIARAVNWTHPCIIRKLDLRNNDMGHSGAAELARAVAHNRTLTTLDITGNNIGVDGCKAIMDAVRHHPTLDRLSMGNNNIRAEGAHIVRDAVLENQKLRRLDIPSNKIGPKGASFVARLIAGMANLNSLDVSDNGLRTAGFQEILSALNENDSLMRIQLRNNPVQVAEGEAALAKAIANDKTVVMIDVTGCGLTCTPRIEEAMAKSHTVRSLGDGVELTPAAKEACARNLANREALERACEAGDLEEVRRLIPISSLYHLQRKTLLHHGVVGGPAVLRELLKVRVIALQVLAKDPIGQTPLHEAAIKSSCDAAHLFLQCGAIANLRDAQGRSPADLTKDPAFLKIMAAEEAFIAAQRSREFVALNKNYLSPENEVGLKSALQVWKSERPVEFGSRFPDSTEPSHPFAYLKDQRAPPHRRNGFWSLDALQRWRDLLIFAVLVAWMYELLEIPFRFGYAPNPIPGGYWALALFMDGLFLFYFIWNMLGHRPAYEPDCDRSEFEWLWSSEGVVKQSTKKELAQRRRKRRQKLMRKRHFWAMLLAAIPWDVVLFIIWLAFGDADHYINPETLDTIQGLRVMRMAIVIMANEHFSIVVGALNLSWATVEMTKMAIWLFYLLNAFGALLYFSGRVALRYGEPSWIDLADFLITPGTLSNSSVFLQYQLTMYYVTFGITNSPFPQANWWEAFLWCLEFLGLGLVFVAYIFGIIIDRIVQLREAREKIQNAQDKIVEYCQDLNLPDKVERKIVKKWMAMGEHDMEIEIRTIGEMISPLSRDLRKEITLHLIWSWIALWQETRDELVSELEEAEALVDEALELRSLNPQAKKEVKLPPVFPFTLFWHTWMKKLCFHPEKYVSFLVTLVDSIDRKLFLQDDMVYDFEDASSDVFMIIEGSVNLRLGRVRGGKETVDCTLGVGDWFGWEALRGFHKRDEVSGTATYVKPKRKTQAKVLKNTYLWVVPASKFRKLFERDAEVRYDLQDPWLANMDTEVLAWTLANFPPNLENNELVQDCETPLEREQMKSVLIKTLVQHGDRGKKSKKEVEQMVKQLSTELQDLKRTTAQEIKALNTVTLSIKEAVAKNNATLVEMIQQTQKLIQTASLQLVDL